MHSVRSLIREGHPDFVVTANSWPAFLYPKANCDIHNIEQGLFRSAILLKVCSKPLPHVILLMLTTPGF
jgi:hypothetical protein